MYNVVLSKIAEIDLLNHIKFLSNVSLKSAKLLRNGFEKIIVRLKENPLQFPILNDSNLPLNKYRTALFFKRYICIFSIKENNIYIDSIRDCRTIR